MIMQNNKQLREASLVFKVSSEPELRKSSTGQQYAIWRKSDTIASVSCNGRKLGEVSAFSKNEMESCIDRLILHQEEYARETANIH